MIMIKRGRIPLIPRAKDPEGDACSNILVTQAFDLLLWIWILFFIVTVLITRCVGLVTDIFIFCIIPYTTSSKVIIRVLELQCLLNLESTRCCIDARWRERLDVTGSGIVLHPELSVHPTPHSLICPVFCSKCRIQ